MPDGLLAFVLARLDRISSPILLHSEAAEFPAPELAALLASGVLRDYVRAEEIRRPKRFPQGRDLIVTETPEGLFGCAQPDDYHEPFPLTDDDVRQYIVVISDFLELLQRANDVKGVVTMSGRDLYSLGERALGERMQAVVYASMPNNDIDRFFGTCGRVKDGYGRRVVVLVPCDIRLSPEQRTALAAMNVRVLSLEQHVTPTSWKLPWDVAEGGASDATSTTSLHDDGWYASSVLAAAFAVSPHALRKRLKQFVHDHIDGFKENEDRRSTEPQFLFQLKHVRPVIEELKQKRRRPALGQQTASRSRK